MTSGSLDILWVGFEFVNLGLLSMKNIYIFRAYEAAPSIIFRVA